MSSPTAPEAQNESELHRLVLLDDLKNGGAVRILRASPGLRILRVDHADVANDQRNLLDLAMKDAAIRSVLVDLANHAFVAYMLKDGVTSFVRRSYIKNLWHQVRDGRFQVDRHGLVYRLDEPLAGLVARHLIVVFSSMAGKIRTSSLMRHFEQNFSTIQKYLPAGTAVLRVADFGGVVGGYYMNSYGAPDTEQHVQGLIAEIATRLGIGHDDVVLYGASKGGSAALFHGVLGRYPVVVADPIVADEHYIKVFKDSHFTVGVFPEDKKEKFSRLSSSVDVKGLPPVAILCSRQSPQFPYITSVIEEPLRSHIGLFDSHHVDIKTHPDVSPKTLNLAVTLLNMQFYKLPIPAGMHVIDEVKHRKDTGSRAL